MSKVGTKDALIRLIALSRQTQFCFDMSKIKPEPGTILDSLEKAEKISPDIKYLSSRKASSVQEKLLALMNEYAKHFTRCLSILKYDLENNTQQVGDDINQLMIKLEKQGNVAQGALRRRKINQTRLGWSKFMREEVHLRPVDKVEFSPSWEKFMGDDVKSRARPGKTDSRSHARILLERFVNFIKSFFSQLRQFWQRLVSGKQEFEDNRVILKIARPVVKYPNSVDFQNSLSLAVAGYKVATIVSTPGNGNHYDDGASAAPVSSVPRALTVGQD